MAFDWDGEKQDNKDIYIKQLDSDGYFRLTDYPGWDSDPAWSPDGRSIAFLRETGSGKYSVIVKPPLGGLERTLAEVDFPLYLLWNRNVAWHPGGKWLVVPDRSGQGGPAGFFLLSVESGEKRRLTAPPAGFAGDSGPAFSPDGRTLAFARYVSENVSDIQLLTLDDRPRPQGSGSSSLPITGVAAPSGPATVTRSSTYQARGITLPCGVLILFTRTITVRCPACTAPSARLSPVRATGWRLRSC